MIQTDDEKKKPGWNRTFNAATDSPENVVKARQANPIFQTGEYSPETLGQPSSAMSAPAKPSPVQQAGSGRDYDPATVGQPAADTPGFSNAPNPLIAALSYSDDRAAIAAKKSAAATPAAAAPEASKASPAAPMSVLPAVAPATSKPVPTNPLVREVSPGGYDPSHLTKDQRGEYAEAYRGAIDSATGTGPGVAGAGQGVDYGTMAKRFDAYKKDDGLLAMRNVREDMLGSGIRMNKDANGGLVISDSGNKANPLLTAGGSSINMQEGNNATAKANAIRGQMIDSMIQAKGGNGVGILGGANAGADQQRQELISKALRPIEGSRGLTANQVRNASELMKQGSDDAFRQQELAARSQQAGITAGIEQQKLAGNPLDNQIKQQQLTAGGRTLEQQQRIDGLLTAMQNETDPAKRAALTETIMAAQGKGSTDRFSVTNRNVYNETGQVVGQESQVFDKAVGSMVDGKTAGKVAQQEVPPPDKRQVGATYQTPKGEFIWRGNGWEAV